MSLMMHPFEYHRPTDEQVRAIHDVRTSLGAAYDIIRLRVPPGPERTLAIRKLEEASMWANKAIVFPESYEK